jgi:phosphatidylserine decarboxylase
LPWGSRRLARVTLVLFLSSLALAFIFLPLLAWKWNIRLKIAIAGAIVIGGLTGLIVSLIGIWFPGLGLGTLVIMEPFLVLLMVLLAVTLRFYRDPERFPPVTEGVILSPADGRVVYVNKIEKTSSLVSTKGKRSFKLDEIMSTNLLDNAVYLIGIDMTILNVHVNRSPIKGKVIFQKRTKGRFVSLRREDSDVLNERVTMVIENSEFSIGVVQIASRLVRRIVSYVRQGEGLEIGQRMGAIVFGSQVDVAIPELKDLAIGVQPGDEVTAGISVIARYG